MPPSPRPDALIVVAGTATEVGKTHVTCALAQALARCGIAVAARKPAQSFAPGPEPTDADLLAIATGADPHEVCPEHRWYPTPMAPPMAASELGLPPPRLQELVAEIRWPPHTAIGFVEAVGGVRSPIAADGDAVALCRAIHPDLALVVAHAGLGTINDSRLASAALREVAPAVVVHLNHFDPGDDLHQRNHQWLADIDHLDVTTSIDALAERVRAAGPR